MRVRACVPCGVGRYVALDGFPRSEENFQDFTALCGMPESDPGLRWGALCSMAFFFMGRTPSFYTRNTRIR